MNAHLRPLDELRDGDLTVAGGQHRLTKTESCETEYGNSADRRKLHVQWGSSMQAGAAQFSLRALFHLMSGAAVLLAALAAAGASAPQSLIGIAAISITVLAASATEWIAVAWSEAAPDQSPRRQVPVDFV